MQLESQQLEDYIEKGRLEEKWEGIVAEARESVMLDREAELEEVGRMKEEERERKERLGGC